MVGTNGALDYRLMAHQQAALEKARLHDAYALFMDTGSGKTLVAIELIKEHFDCYKASYSGRKGIDYPYVCVVCPLSIIETVWRHELTKFAPDISFCNLWKHRKDDKRKLPEADVYVINYESFHRLPAWLLARFHFVILDESSKIKNPRAQVTKFVLKHRDRWPRRLEMSGTPAPNHLLEYWSQMAFINPAILGNNFFRFRAMNFYQAGFRGYLWLPSKDFKANVGKLLAKQAFVVSKADCLDLPPQVFQSRQYVMPPKLRKSYDQMLKLNITELSGESVVGVNQLAKIMKLRQITSGFVIGVDGHTLDVHDGKLKLMREVLEEAGENQVLIWCQFHWEIDTILRELGDKAAGLYGKQSQAIKDENIRRFQRGDVQYLVAHPKSGGHGLNFTNCSNVVYFSLSYSLEEEKQSMDRCHRIGQTKSVTYNYLLAEKSIDEVIYRALRRKQKLSDAVLDMVKENA